MENSLILALYGAITSSIAIGWNIYNSIIQYKGKLKVEQERSFTFPPEGNKVIAMCSCKVTNIGRVTRYIDMPKLEYVSSKDIVEQASNDLMFYQIQPANKYPAELKSGEVHIVDYNLNDYYIKF
jgi:hypothetical protein